MKSKNRQADSSSLDMLLDTMCNTFGGVCFIALLIAIISSALPKDPGEEQVPEVSEQSILDKETAMLVLERDTLRAAIQLQEELLKKQQASTDVLLSTEQLISQLSSNKLDLVKLNAQRLQLEDEIATMTTTTDYSRREAARLERLLKDMEAKLGQQKDLRRRTMRTPVERNLLGFHSYTLWLYNGMLYEINDTTQVNCEIKDGPNGRTWDYTIKPGKGIRVTRLTDLSNMRYTQIFHKLTSKQIIRIYSDTISFPQLCMIRDDLVARHQIYNWDIHEGSPLHFVEGPDNVAQ